MYIDITSVCQQILFKIHECFDILSNYSLAVKTLAKSSSMGKKGGGKKKKITSSNGGDNMFAMIDPLKVRFQHSRIRPIFSGCGRSVEATLEEIRQGKLSPEKLPPIQVIAGVGDEEGWYFTLNNRRLWVLKRCREEGLLKNNEIRVRVRMPKSAAEAERYSVKNCALEAKFLRERLKNDVKLDKNENCQDEDTENDGGNERDS